MKLWVVILSILLAGLSAHAQTAMEIFERWKPFDWNERARFIKLPEFVLPPTFTGQRESSIFTNLLHQAQNGDAVAQREVGNCYYNGRMVEKSYDTASYWYTLSAQQDDAIAQNNLGVMYLDGLSFPQNFGEALKWFMRSARNNCEMGQYHLALLYEFGFGVTQDFERAATLLETAATRMLGLAEIRLAIYYSKGHPFVRRQDYAKAYEFACLAFAHGRDDENVSSFRKFLQGQLTDDEVRRAQRRAQGRNIRLVDRREKEVPKPVVIIGPQ